MSDVLSVSRDAYDCERRRAEKAEARAAAAEAQLPEGMKHCTIVFRECSLGHGWLTATNWAQHGCPTCARNEQRGRAEAWKNTVNELAGQKTHLLARAAALQAEVARLRAAIETHREAIYEKHAPNADFDERLWGALEGGGE